VPESVPLPGSVRAAALRNILYSPQVAALVPQAVYTATLPLEDAGADSADMPPGTGDLQPFIALAGAVGGDSLSDTMSLGLMLSVACSEDVHRIEAAHVERSRAAFLGDQLIDVARQWCAEWPVEPTLHTPVSGVSWDGPVLLMSGQLDPVTPPRWAETAAETLPDHVHIIVPGGGHIVAASGCVPEKMAEFIDAEAAVATMIDISCADNTVRPPFALDFAGPRG
jgi:pimeloyl-ACP methyl ester carboxylesterase